jgi:hypothetical protein
MRVFGRQAAKKTDSEVKLANEKINLPIFS